MAKPLNLSKSTKSDVPSLLLDDFADYFGNFKVVHRSYTFYICYRATKPPTYIPGVQLQRLLPITAIDTNATITDKLFNCFFKTHLWPWPVITAAGSVEVNRNSGIIHRICKDEELNFSHVKFYQDLSTGLENLPGKLLNTGMIQLSTKIASRYCNIRIWGFVYMYFNVQLYTDVVTSSSSRTALRTLSHNMSVKNF